MTNTSLILSFMAWAILKNRQRLSQSTEPHLAAVVAKLSPSQNRKMPAPQNNLPARFQRLDRGKLAVIGMFAIAIVAAGFAAWWQFNRTKRCLEFYGSEGASLVRTAPQVALLELIPVPDSDPERLSPTASPLITIAQQQFAVVRQVDLSQAKGLIHARHSVLDDNSFQWDRPSPASPPQVRYAVRFSRQPESITLAFDFASRQLYAIDRKRQATLIPKVAAGWQTFLERQTAVHAGPSNPTD
jgi:hypothetical protein